MAADPLSLLMVWLGTAADEVIRLSPYLLGGLAAAALFGRQKIAVRWIGPLSQPFRLSLPVAAVAGVASPIPTLGTVPLLVRLKEGRPAKGSALAFVLASTLLNPQLLVLTIGVMGVRFALLQLVAVLVISTLLGWLSQLGLPGLVTGRTNPNPDLHPSGSAGQMRFARLAEHVVLHFLIGIMAAAALRVVLPYSGILNELGRMNLLSIPFLGSLGALFYSCGGSAVPLAGGLFQVGISTGTLFAFLLTGPALRGKTLACLTCLLSKRAALTCLAAIVLYGGACGYLVDWLWSWV